MRLFATVLMALAFLALSTCTRREPLAEFNAVPNFQLVDQSGASFLSAEKLAGKVWVADFIFTNCAGPCPRMGSQMKQVQTALADVGDVLFVSFTVDPKRDTPEVLATYAKRFSAQAGRWFFLTGPMETLNDLSANTFMLAKLTGEADHSTRFALVDRRGRVRKYYQTTDAESIPNLINDARTLAQAAP